MASASKTISGWSGAGSRSFTLKVEETAYNAKTNKSTVKWTLTVANESYWYDSYVKCIVNGTVVYNKTVSWNGGFPAETGSISGTMEITHDSSGEKSITFSLEGYAYSHSVISSGNGTLVLTNLDRTPPTVATTIGTVTKNSIAITATADVACNKWWYRLNAGEWVSFSTTSGTSASKTISGLEPNTQYTIDVSARKTSNDVDGYAASVTEKTLGASAIRNASAVTLGSACNVAWVPLDSTFKFKLTFAIGSTSKTTGLISPASTNPYTYTGYTPAIADFAGAIPNAAIGSMTIILTTYLSDGTTVVGTSETIVDVMVPENSTTKPTVGTVTCAEGTASGFSCFCSTLSTVKATITGAAGKYGASITEIKMEVEGAEYIANSSGVATSATLRTTGTIPVKITVTDSRGFTNTSTTNITVYEYFKPSGSITCTPNGTSFDIDVTWKIAPVFVSSKTKNTVSVIVTRKKISTGATASQTVKTVAANQTAVTQYNSSGSWTGQGLTDGTTETYEYTLKVQDAKGATYAATYVVSTGITALSILGGGKGVTFFGEAQNEGLWIVEEGTYKNIAVGNARLFYGTCATAAAAKTVVCSQFKAKDLVPGTILIVKFTATNTGAVGSITLNVNSTGAKNVKYINNNAYENIPAVGYIVANMTYMLVYDGTYWVITSLNYNSTYSSMSQAEADAGTATSARSISAKVLSDKILTAAEYLSLAKLLAEDYSATKAYEVGDFVKYSSNIYECNTACTAAAWSTNSGKFTLIGAAS